MKLERYDAVITMQCAGTKDETGVTTHQIKIGGRVSGDGLEGMAEKMGRDLAKHIRIMNEDHRVRADDATAKVEALEQQAEILKAQLAEAKKPKPGRPSKKKTTRATRPDPVFPED